MDSPLLPTIRGGPRDLDDTFADMSLASARSPSPEPEPEPRTTLHQLELSISPDHQQQQQQQQHQYLPPRKTIFGRPAPTRIFDETPEAPTRTVYAASGSRKQGMGNVKPRQSIFPALGSSGPPRSVLGSPTSSLATEVKTEHGQDEGDVTIHANGDAGASSSDNVDSEVSAESRARREERLKDSLYELRGINDTFETFLYALESARGHNERLARRVQETSTLLNQYTAFLGQAEHTQKLLSNPNWTGADDDIREVEAEQAAREAAEMEAARKVEEAETARREEEDRVQRATDEAARAKEAPSRGGSRGRGIPTRGGVVRGRGTGIPPPSARTVSGGKPVSTTRPAPPGSGLGGQYANVKSSGYGPSRKAT